MAEENTYKKLDIKFRKNIKLIIKSLFFEMFVSFENYL